jgi:hypothetical protein
MCINLKETQWNRWMSLREMVAVYSENYTNCCGMLRKVLHVVNQRYKNLPKTQTHLKILGARNVAWKKVLPEDPQILGTNVKTLVATATWRPGIVDPCAKHSV